MNRADLKYYAIPIVYLVCVLLTELFLNFVTSLLFIIVLLASIIGIIFILIGWEKRKLKIKAILISLLFIPILDLTFGLTTRIRNHIKGEIVFLAMDDSFGTSKVITVRNKNGELTGEYEGTVAGFGDVEKTIVKINSDTLIFKLLNREYGDSLVLFKNDKKMRSIHKNGQYRILVNNNLIKK